MLSIGINDIPAEVVTVLAESVAERATLLIAVGVLALAICYLPTTAVVATIAVLVTIVNELNNTIS